MKKKLVNSKIAILVSPRHGAGWYSWHESEQLLFEPKIISMILENASRLDIIEYCEENYPNLDISGLDGLEVMFVDPCAKFRISEYDGAETLVLQDEEKWITA